MGDGSGDGKFDMATAGILGREKKGLRHDMKARYPRMNNDRVPYTMRRHKEKEPTWMQTTDHERARDNSSVTNDADEPIQLCDSVKLRNQ